MHVIHHQISRSGTPAPPPTLTALLVPAAIAEAPREGHRGGGSSPPSPSVPISPASPEPAAASRRAACTRGRSTSTTRATVYWGPHSWLPWRSRSRRPLSSGRSPGRSTSPSTAPSATGWHTPWLPARRTPAGGADRRRRARHPRGRGSRRSHDAPDRRTPRHPRSVPLQAFPRQGASRRRSSPRRSRSRPRSSNGPSRAARIPLAARRGLSPLRPRASHLYRLITDQELRRDLLRPASRARRPAALPGAG